MTSRCFFTADSLILLPFFFGNEVLKLGSNPSGFIEKDDNTDDDSAMQLLSRLPLLPFLVLCALSNALADNIRSFFRPMEDEPSISLSLLAPEGD